MSQPGFENPFLARVMAAIRANRPLLSAKQPFYNRVEQVPSGRYAELWFQTAGCTWDKQGGCTMCNYGAGHALSVEESVGIVRAGLRELPPAIEELMISPSGSLLDPLEVDPALRREIYSLAAAYGPRKFLIETRSEWVVDETMAELRASQPPGRAVAVEIGLESADPWKLRYCVNKGGGPDDFKRAAAAAHRHGVQVYANICLGTAFLNPIEMIEDSFESTMWALESGADNVVLFPLHIKPFTLLDTMTQAGAYSAVSLWSLVDVLRRIDPALLPRVEIAWYRSYYDSEAKILTSPSTCPECHDAVVGLLDRYRREQSRAAVDALLGYDCACREPWSKSLAIDARPLSMRVADGYRSLAEKLGLADWLAKRPPPFFADPETARDRVGEAQA